MIRRAFSLVELLVVIAILSLLMSMLLPSLGAVRRIARVTRAVAEMKGISTALELYAQEHEEQYPPERSYCSADLMEHSAQLPPELADAGLLPAAPADSPLSAGARDVFRPGFTYRYQRPGWGLHNNAAVLKHLWIPDAFPHDPPTADVDALPRKKFNNVSSPLDASGTVTPCPVRYALWSVGPGFDPQAGPPRLAPMARSSWYAGAGTSGVVPYIVMDNGQVVTHGN